MEDDNKLQQIKESIDKMSKYSTHLEALEVGLVLLESLGEQTRMKWFQSSFDWSLEKHPDIGQIIANDIYEALVDCFEKESECQRKREDECEDASASTSESRQLSPSRLIDWVKIWKQAEVSPKKRRFSNRKWFVVKFEINVQILNFEVCIEFVRPSTPLRS